VIIYSPVTNRLLDATYAEARKGHKVWNEDMNFMDKKREVVFIVYRNGWWGCFDGIYRELVQKEDLVCYVISIPHYRWKEDGSAYDEQTEQYSRDSLPDYVRTIDCREYNVRIRKPSVIYIHNPYDNTNPLETVAPEYYSENLKKCTEKLVYVPHLLFLGAVSECYKHLNVYDYVDEIYFNTDYTKYSLDIIYEKKIRVVPSGIPNYMNMLQQQQGQQSVCDGMKLLCVLYYEDLYYGAERTLEKLKTLFEYLKDREDYEVIFRPDELLWINKRMITEKIWNCFEKMLDWFEKEQIGKIDKSENLYEAAVQADAYVGFGGIMQLLFGIQGKYRLIVDRLNRELPGEEIYIPLISELEREGNKVWFMTNFTDLLCEVDLDSGEITVLSQLPEDNFGRKSIFGLKKINHFLYAFPFSSDGLWKYDLRSGEWDKIFIDCATQAGNFGKVFYYKNAFYMVPRFFSGILEYELLSERFTVYDGWKREIDLMTTQDMQEEPYFMGAIVQQGNKLCMVSSKVDVYMEFDLDSKKYSMKKMGIDGMHFSHMYIEGDYVWLLPYLANDIYVWNRKTGESKKIYQANSVEERKIPFAFIIGGEKYLWVFPRQEEFVLRIDRKSGKCQSITNMLPCARKEYLYKALEKKLSGYPYVEKQQNGTILAYECYDGAFLILQDKGDKLEIAQKILFRTPKEAFMRHYLKRWKRLLATANNNGIIKENYSLLIALECLKRLRGVNTELIKENYMRKLR